MHFFIVCHCFVLFHGRFAECGDKLCVLKLDSFKNLFFSLIRNIKPHGDNSKYFYYLRRNFSYRYFWNQSQPYFSKTQFPRKVPSESSALGPRATINHRSPSLQVRMETSSSDLCEHVPSFQPNRALSITVAASSFCFPTSELCEDLSSRRDRNVFPSLVFQNPGSS